MWRGLLGGDGKGGDRVICSLVSSRLVSMPASRAYIGRECYHQERSIWNRCRLFITSGDGAVVMSCIAEAHHPRRIKVDIQPGNVLRDNQVRGNPAKLICS